MDAFLALPIEERRQLCSEAQARLHLRAASIEKDFWICWALRELFSLEGLGEHLTFKGGTSLSKCWKLIERFSEDLDVTVGRGFLGFGGENEPGAAASGAQRARRVEELRARCERWVGETLAPRLLDRFKRKLAAVDGWSLLLDPEDKSGLTLLYTYPTIYPPSDPRSVYVRPVVKIELGALSDTEPFGLPTIRPYMAEEFPELIPDSEFSIRAVAPVRTFWEKAMLLHEEGFRAGGVGPKRRMARHYYDLWCLVTRGVADEALRDPRLFERIAAHRAIYFRKNRLARESLRRGSLRILPRDEHRSLWEEDYRAMAESMIFGETPSFEEMLTAVQRFENAFNQGEARETVASSVSE